MRLAQAPQLAFGISGLRRARGRSRRLLNVVTALSASPLARVTGGELSNSRPFEVPLIVFGFLDAQQGGLVRAGPRMAVFRDGEA